MAGSPTTRTKKALENEGYRVAVVERWNPHAMVRQDLFGIIDVLAIREGETLAVQCTSYNNISSRVKKVAEAEATPDIRDAGWRIEVHGWRKVKGRWQCRVVDCS